MNMVATTLSPPAVDLTSQATIPIRLGDSLLKPSQSKRFTSIRYNYKPRIDSGANVKCRLKRSALEEDGSYALDLRVGDKPYAYQSNGTDEEDYYVLIAMGSGSERDMVLERLNIYGEFNIIRTPEEKSSSKVRDKHPQLPYDDDAQHGASEAGSHDIQASADRQNPFDYRNYLKSGSARPKLADVEPPRSTANTPLLQPRAASNTPHSRPSKRSDDPLITQKKRKAPENSKTNVKRVNAGTELPVPTAARQNIPRLRMDRKASLHLGSLDDVGELVLENETPVLEKPRSAMSLALSGQLGQGPISLHTAASSPGSKVASPMPPRPEHIDENEEFELGESSPEASSKWRPGDDGDADEEDEDADADADVEDLELPSPAQTHRRAEAVPQGSAVDAAEDKSGADDEDDLDKQLELAMAEEDAGDAAPPPVQAESDEESEEE